MRATLPSFSPSLHPRLSFFALTISATRVSLRCITMNRSGNCAFNISKLFPSKHEKSLRFSPMSQEIPSLFFSFISPHFFFLLFSLFYIFPSHFSFFYFTQSKLAFSKSTKVVTCFSLFFLYFPPFQILVPSFKLALLKFYYRNIKSVGIS